MRMKPVRVATFGALFLLVLVLTLLILTVRSPNAPKLVPLHSPPTGSFVEMDYDWLGAVPAQDGHLWITAWSTTNWHFFLYDWTNRLVVGELLNANPVFFNQDQTKLLCEGYSLEGSWKSRVARWLGKFRMGKSLAQKINQVEAFWVLNLKDGSAEPIGKVSQFPGEGSRFLAA